VHQLLCILLGPRIVKMAFLAALGLRYCPFWELWSATSNPASNLHGTVAAPSCKRHVFTSHLLYSSDTCKDHQLAKNMHNSIGKHHAQLHCMAMQYTDLLSHAANSNGVHHYDCTPNTYHSKTDSSCCHV
jgi:hypothetical protein